MKEDEHQAHPGREKTSPKLYSMGFPNMRVLVQKQPRKWDKHFRNIGGSLSKHTHDYQVQEPCPATILFPLRTLGSETSPYGVKISLLLVAKFTADHVEHTTAMVKSAVVLMDPLIARAKANLNTKGFRLQNHQPNIQGLYSIEDHKKP